MGAFHRLLAYARGTYTNSDHSSTMAKALIGPKVVSKNGEVATADLFRDTSVVGLYFSAHWCPPCRGFTPVLAEFYKKMKDAGKDFEVIFVSSDRDQASFDEYYAEMPWHALSWENKDSKGKLSTEYGVSGIPTLILLDGKDETTINTNGRQVVCDDPEGANFPW